MGVAHTTVARKLAELEAYFGAELFVRLDGGLTPTEDGQRLIETAEVIDRELAEAERAVRGRDTRLAGRVRLTTTDVLARKFMPRIAALGRRYPGIDLDLDFSTATRNLSRREAEMALRMTNAPEEHLFGRKLGRFGFFPYLRADLDRNAVPWITYGGRECGGHAAGWLRRQGRDGAGLSVPTPLAMLEAIRAGAGAGLLPAEIADPEAELTRLSESEAFGLDIWLLAPPELRGNARIRAVFEVFGAP